MFGRWTESELDHLYVPSTPPDHQTRAGWLCGSGRADHTPPYPPPSTLPLACLYPHTDPPYRTALRRPLKNERCGALGARQTLTCGREGWDVEQGGDRSPALPATALQSPEIWSITIVQG